MSSQVQIFTKISIIIFFVLKSINVYTKSDTTIIFTENDFFKLKEFIKINTSDSLIIKLENLKINIEKNFNLTINENIKYLFFDAGNSSFTSDIQEDKTIGSVYGIFEFIGHQNVEIILKNFNINYKSTDYGNQCGIYIDAKGGEVKIENVYIYGVTYLGIFIERANGGFIRNTITNNNKFGGIGLRTCKNMVIEDCEFSYNGSQAPKWGYGFALVNCYPLNENIIVRNNKALNNQRKGLDVHSGINILFEKNYVKGFNYAGIYAVSDGGKDRRAANITIKDNFVDGDTAHFRVKGIDIGSWGKNPDSSGYFIVENNKIINLDDIVGSSAICVVSPDSGVAVNQVVIKNNEIINGSADKKTAAIKCETKYVPVNNIIIENNKIHSAYSNYPISIKGAVNVQISNNQFNGIENNMIKREGVKVRKVKNKNILNNIILK